MNTKELLQFQVIFCLSPIKKMGFAKFNIYSLRFIRQVQVHNTNVILLVFSNEQNSDGAGQDRAEARKYE